MNVNQSVDYANTVTCIIEVVNHKADDFNVEEHGNTINTPVLQITIFHQQSAL